MKLLPLLLASASFLIAQSPAPQQPTLAEQKQLRADFQRVQAANDKLRAHADVVRSKYNVPPSCQLNWASQADSQIFHWACIPAPTPGPVPVPPQPPPAAPEFPGHTSPPAGAPAPQPSAATK
jgi:hypothetical protein